VKQERIRIAVVDDHGVFAEALATRLSAEPDLEVVGTAGSSAEALELFSHHEIDVVTVELVVAGEDGLTLGRQLLDQWPDLGILVVTGVADDNRVCEAVQMGVRGWVAKQGAVEALLIAVRGAARGETHLPAALVTRVLASLSERGRWMPEAEAIALLTARELDVLRCLMDGRARRGSGGGPRRDPPAGGFGDPSPGLPVGAGEVEVRGRSYCTPDGARARRVALSDGRKGPQRDWCTAAYLAEHRPHPHPEHLAQAQRPLRPHSSGVRSPGGSGAGPGGRGDSPNDLLRFVRARGSPLVRSS